MPSESLSRTIEDSCGDGAFTPASKGWLYRIVLRHKAPVGMCVCVSPIVSLAVGKDRPAYLRLPRVCTRTGTHRRRSLHLLDYSITGTDALSDKIRGGRRRVLRFDRKDGRVDETASRSKHAGLTGSQKRVKRECGCPEYSRSAVHGDR